MGGSVFPPVVVVIVIVLAVVVPLLALPVVLPEVVLTEGFARTLATVLALTLAFGGDREPVGLGLDRFVED